MDIESKLDEDFLFYLGFTSSFSSRISDCADRQLANAWLQKLCGERFPSVNEKRSRNLFLSNLLLHMQDGKLLEPFTMQPAEVDLSDGKRWFATVKMDETTNWLKESEEQEEDSHNKRDDGRTYVATRSMPGGEGAFAYVAVSLDEKDPWLGGQKGAFDAALDQKYREYCPEPNEMEIILARRKDTNERQRVLTFYDVLLQNIADELDGKITAEENHSITLVMDQLIADLKTKGQYDNYDHMKDEDRRIELLLVLFDRTHNRREKVAKREEVLDDIEQSFRASFFANSNAGNEEEKYEMPAQMWEYAINRPPIKKHMERMQVLYPPFIIEKFMELLSNQKEEIAIRMQRRHTSIVGQMKRELQKEGDKLRKWVNDIKTQCDDAVDVLAAVKEAYNKQKESYDKEAKRKKGGDTKLTSLYNEMKEALYDTQQLVEEEAERGRAITEKINGINAQAEAFTQVTECSIMRTEEANMETMKNIKRLKAAITQHQKRLKQMESMREGLATDSATQFFV